MSLQCSGGSDKLCVQRPCCHRPAECSVSPDWLELPAAAERQRRLLLLPAGEVSDTTRTRSVRSDSEEPEAQRSVWIYTTQE